MYSRVFRICVTVVAGASIRCKGDFARVFECRLELFEVITQDYREAFKLSAITELDQSFFLNRHIMDFLDYIICRIVQRSSLLEKKSWETLWDFNFSSVEFLDVPRSWKELSSW